MVVAVVTAMITGTRELEVELLPSAPSAPLPQQLTVPVVRTAQNPAPSLAIWPTAPTVIVPVRVSLLTPFPLPGGVVVLVSHIWTN